MFITQPRSRRNTSISKRVTVSLNPTLFTLLQVRSDQEGRSLSNLCAYLLECAMNGQGG
jgi:hypothetical protein